MPNHAGGNAQLLPSTLTCRSVGVCRGLIYKAFQDCRFKVLHMLLCITTDACISSQTIHHVSYAALYVFGQKTPVAHRSHQNIKGRPATEPQPTSTAMRLVSMNVLLKYF